MSSEGRILDVGERLVQTRGFNGFSYANIAEELGVTSASIHYHFPTKADLGAALIERYADRFQSALGEIETGQTGACAQLERYIALHEQVVVGERMCLCGMLAAELGTLPDAMRARLDDFFALNQAWVTRLMERGRDGGEMDFDGPADTSAASVVATLQGAMLMARAHGGVRAFRNAAEHLRSALCRRGGP